MYNKKRHIHFVGIGGSGMSGIAELLLNLGNCVSGSDIATSDVTQRLDSLGASVAIGHDEKNIAGAEVVVISSAVCAENVEVRAAEEKRVPVIQRAEMLAELMRLRTGIAVAGSHGKTTTTSMIGAVLTSGGVDPTIVVGGKLKSLGTGARLGRGEFIVAEADESDGSFLRLSPAIAVITNVDAEHLEYYGDLAGVQDTFLKFINHLPFYGAAVLCVDDNNSRELLSRFKKRAITYGFSDDAHVRAKNIRQFGNNTYFEVVYKGETVGDVDIGVAGKHNVLNALAAIAVGFELELSFFSIREGLRGFEGVQRRFQVKGERDGVTVIDDYGHHPTEIIATLLAVQEGWPSRRVLTVFQPHRYTRTRDMKDAFFTAFRNTDELIITSIYEAGEKPIEGIDAGIIFDGVKKSGGCRVEYIQKLDDIPRKLRALSRPGDIIITMGAGDIWKVGEAFLEEEKWEQQ